MSAYIVRAAYTLGGHALPGSEAQTHASRADGLVVYIRGELQKRV